MSSTSNACRGSRSGISLIEILMSIAVVAIGLLGVAAMIPLAHSKANRALRQDRIAQFGRAAFCEFHVREFDKPGSLDAPYWVSVYGLDDIYDPVTGRLIPQLYCFDPLGLAETDGGLSFIAGRRFTRITVLSSRAEDLVSTNCQPAPYASLAELKTAIDNGLSGGMATFNQTPLMQRGQARRCFELQDDVQFLREGNDRPVKSKFFTDLSGRNLRRESNGQLSWMATLAPKAVFERTSPSGIARTKYANDHRYRMSVVIFENRDLAGNGDDLETRLLHFIRSDMTGSVKEAEIQSSQARNIQKNDWVLLANGGFGRNDLPWWHWYRVTYIDDKASDTEARSRLLRLEGPDWPGEPGRTVIGYYVPGVVAVYEKTIRLQP